MHKKKSIAQHLKGEVRQDQTVGTSHFKVKSLQKLLDTRNNAWAKVIPKVFLMAGGFWPGMGAGGQTLDLPGNHCVQAESEQRRKGRDLHKGYSQIE